MMSEATRFMRRASLRITRTLATCSGYWPDRRTGAIDRLLGTTGASRSRISTLASFASATRTDARRPRGEAFGYHVPFQAVLSNDHGYTLWARPGSIDPYGWRAGSIDPMAYRWSNARSGYGNVIGIGAWSPDWKSAKIPPYPEE